MSTTVNSDNHTDVLARYQYLCTTFDDCSVQYSFENVVSVLACVRKFNDLANEIGPGHSLYNDCLNNSQKMLDRATVILAKLKQQ